MGCALLVVCEITALTVPNGRDCQRYVYSIFHKQLPL